MEKEIGTNGSRKKESHLDMERYGEEMSWEERAARVHRERDPVYQVSTLQALVMGNFYGSAAIEHVLEHGDTGLGTFHAVAGELVVIDGHAYRILGDGRAVEAKPHDTTPFASVAYLTDRAYRIKLGRVPSLDVLRDVLDERVELLGVNNMYLVRIDGYFRRVAARTELSQQEPFLPFAEVLKTDERRFAFEEVAGSLVCFYFPPYLDGVNTPGWHFHFIDAVRQHGGHVFGLCMEHGIVRMQKSDRFIMDLPHNDAFQDARLENASKDDIRQIEQGE